jgi:hypothetical protein
MNSTVGLSSSLEKAHGAKSEIDTSYPSVTIGEYTIYPLEYCHEDEAAELFCSIAPRGNPGNPVLQGRPAADLKLLGRAMYRKSNISRMGNVAFHNGKAVAIGCNWDVADGGVWEGSGLEMPASMEAHAQIGQTAFASLDRHGKKTWYCGFYGVVPGHSATLFSYLGTMGCMMARTLGFEDMFVYSMLPSLQGREGMYSRKSNANETHWKVLFADIDDASPAVSAELKELDGTLALGLSDITFTLEDDYLTGVAKMTRIKGGVDALRGPSQEMADKQLAWIKQTQSAQSDPIIGRIIATQKKDGRQTVALSQANCSAQSDPIIGRIIAKL